MSRTTIDFGIDLGTTNSAIAVLRGVTPEIIKNNTEADITPSAVSIDKKGTIHVGQRARNRVIDYGEDTFIEFKRRMGTDHVYHFKSSGQSRKPEELSAEMLKSLRADVQARTGEVVEAAVISVPAAFELHQCDATRRAAHLAGFKESPLLTEPVAAALAYGFQGDRGKAYWLVYDFGGGTFDAAIMKAEEGTIHVVNSGGDNFLGGSDIDWAILEKLIVPRILQTHNLKDFNRANAGVGMRWYRAFMRLKFAAEQAKIDLSRKEVTHLSDSDYARNLIDDLTKEVVIEEMEMEISRREVIALAEPFILRSIEITKRVIKEKGLLPSDIERVILVGGPTLSPYFREMLSSNLGIPLDYSVDPLTVVARGAAVFAGTQRFNAHAVGPVPAGEFTIDLEHKPVGIDIAPMVGGKISGPSTQDFRGFTVELINTKTQWRSGKLSLGPEGVFIANLHVEHGERNTFAIELLNANGQKQKTRPDTLTYTVGVSLDEQPLINAMGVVRRGVEHDEYVRYFEKGRGLPLRKTETFRTAILLRQGQTGEVVRIPIVEGENERADRNRVLGLIRIEAKDISRDLPVNSEIDVTLSIDASRIIHAKAYVHLLDDEFELKAVIELKPAAPNQDKLAAELDAAIKRLHKLRAEASVAGCGGAQDLLAKVEQSNLLQQIRELVAAAKGDPDAAAKCEKRLLELQIQLDEAENAMEWPSMVAEARDWLGYLSNIAEESGTEEQRTRSEYLTAETAAIIEEKHADKLRKRIETIQRLYWDITFAQPGYWVQQLKRLEKVVEQMSDRPRAARLLDQGRECMEKDNSKGLQNVVRQLWDLLPKQVAEAAKLSITDII